MNRWIKFVVKMSKVYDHEKLVNKVLESDDPLKGMEAYFTDYDLLEDYYNQKYPRKPVIYKGRNVPLKNGVSQSIGIDVRNFFSEYDSQIKEITKKKVKISNSDDTKALKCLKWVIDNISYVGDKENNGLPEFWQFPFETLHFKKGDCEDGAILLANMMLMAGIPYWKIRMTAGWVKTGNGRGGHAYVTYYSEKHDKWVTLDWCYYPNKKKVKDREYYDENPIYLDIWFSWNKKFCFSKIPGSKLEINT